MHHRHAQRYVLRQFGLRSLLKFGFALGIAAGFVPSLITTLAVAALVSFLKRFLEHLMEVSQPLPLLNQRITFDFVQLLHLSGAYESLVFVDNNLGLFALALFLLLSCVVAISFGIASITGAIVYNVLAKTTGGLEFELEEGRTSASKE